MGEKFFYDWTKEQVWSVIESTFRDQTEWQNNEEKVREEFNKLQANQAGDDTDFLKRCILESDVPERLNKASTAAEGSLDERSCWLKYIEPVLKSLQKEKYRRFNDPIHGTIELHPLLCKIIDTPEFHRLNDIKQLGGVHYVYPNARHTRFEHSIGVCYLAGEFARMLQKKQPELEITDKDVLCVEIAGLIHDLGHGPFSHMFEYGVYEQLKLEYPDNFRKETDEAPELSPGSVAEDENKEEDAVKKEPQQGEVAVEEPQEQEPQQQQQEEEAPSQSIELPKEATPESEPQAESEGVQPEPEVEPEPQPEIEQQLAAKYRPWEHEELSKRVFRDKIHRYLEAEFDSYGITDSDVEFISELIHYNVKNLRRPQKAVLYQIVANKFCGIDVDKWDYFARDGHFIGVAHDFDFNRLMSMSRAIRRKIDGKWMICYRMKEMNNIYGMFRTRCSLFQRALHHKTKIAAELMLCRAIALAAKAVKLSFTVTDRETQQQENRSSSLLSVVVDAQKDPTTGSIDGFLALTDSIIYAIKVANPKDSNLSQDDSQKLEAAQKLLLRLSKREMFHEVKLEATDAMATDQTKHALQEKLDEQQLLRDNDSGLRSVFVQLVDYKYGSEQVSDTNQDRDKSPLKWNDPVRKVYFYEKQKPGVAWPGEDPPERLKALMQQTTHLVRPEKFSVSQLKVYSDLGAEHDFRIIEVIKKVLRLQTDKPQQGDNSS